MDEHQNQLPEIRKDVDAQVSTIDENGLLVKLQKFSALVNKLPEQGKLQEHPVVKGVMYLPISFMEMTLDELYFGLWQTSDFRWQQIGNELVGSIVLEVFHPIAKVWLKRTGAAGHQIPVDAIPDDEKKKMTKSEINQWATNLEHKKPAGLDNGAFASLKAECFRNACLNLGKYFGRDVNRQFVDSYNQLVKPTDDELKKARKKLSDLIDQCQDTDLREKIINEALYEEDMGKPTVAFYEKMCTKLNPNG